MNRSMNLQQMFTRSLCMLGLVGLTLISSPVAADVFDPGQSDPSSFDTVINLPEDPTPDSVGGDGLTTQLNIFDGGFTDPFFEANSGSEVNIIGGFVDLLFQANSGSEVNISGGGVAILFQANSGSVVNISGGSFDAFFANPGSEVNISGGSFGDFFMASSDSEVNLLGSEFALDGVPLDSLMIDETFTISDREAVLSGLLTDGSAINFDISSTQEFDPAATLTVTLVSPVPEPGSLVLLGLGGVVLLGRRRKSCS